MLVQASLCRTCSETTLLVFPRGGANVVSVLFFSLFILSFLKPMNWALYTSSVLVGFGAASRYFPQVHLQYESVSEKNNNLGSDQV